MLHRPSSPFRTVLRFVPPIALAASALTISPASAAGNVVTASSPGPLTVAVGASPSPAIVGQPVQVGLAVTNISPDPIGPFTMGIQVSPNAKVTATTTAGVHTCTKAGNGFACDLLGALQPGLTQNAWSLTMVPQSAGPITITGFVQPVLGSSAPANSVSMTLQAVAVSQADLQITQSASTGQPAFGAPMSYGVAVKNSGPDTATSVVLTDTLGADGLAQSAVASNGAACSVAGQTVTCSLGDIPAGSQVSVKIEALAPALIGGTSPTVASVSAPTFDPNAANNTASTAITPR